MVPGFTRRIGSGSRRASLQLESRLAPGAQHIAFPELDTPNGFLLHARPRARHSLGATVRSSCQCQHQHQHARLLPHRRRRGVRLRLRRAYLRSRRVARQAPLKVSLCAGFQSGPGQAKLSFAAESAQLRDEPGPLHIAILRPSWTSTKAKGQPLHVLTRRRKLHFWTRPRGWRQHRDD